MNQNDNDNDDSNASDNSFVPDKEYKNEFNNKLKLDMEPFDENQEDHFKTTSQRNLGEDFNSTTSSLDNEDNDTTSTGSI